MWMPGNSENPKHRGFAIPAVVGAIVVSLGLVAMFQSVMSQQRSLDLVLEADLKSRLAADSGLEWLRMLSEKTRTKLQAERGKITSHLELYQEELRGHAFADIFATNLGEGIVSYVIRGSWESPSGNRTRTVFEGDMRFPPSEEQAGQVLNIQELSSQPASGDLSGVDIREVFENDNAEAALLAMVQKGVRDRQKLQEIQRARFLAQASNRRDLLAQLEHDPTDAILEEILKASTDQAIELWLMRDFIQNLDSLPDNARLVFQPTQQGLFGLNGETRVSPQKLARLLEGKAGANPDVEFLAFMEGFKAHQPQIEERGRRNSVSSLFTDSSDRELTQIARTRGGPKNLAEMNPDSRQEKPRNQVALQPDRPQEFVPSQPVEESSDLPENMKPIQDSNAPEQVATAEDSEDTDFGLTVEKPHNPVGSGDTGSTDGQEQPSQAEARGIEASARDLNPGEVATNNESHLEYNAVEKVVNSSGQPENLAPAEGSMENIYGGG